jgi:hypothetical protein
MHNKNGDAASFAGIPVSNLAPQVRLELTTLRLTAGCSAIELLRNTRPASLLAKLCLGAVNFYNRRWFESQTEQAHAP